jgi:hypothetical protein
MSKRLNNIHFFTDNDRGKNIKKVTTTTHEVIEIGDEFISGMRGGDMMMWRVDEVVNEQPSQGVYTEKIPTNYTLMVSKIENFSI